MEPRRIINNESDLTAPTPQVWFPLSLPFSHSDASFFLGFLTLPHHISLPFYFRTPRLLTSASLNSRTCNFPFEVQCFLLHLPFTFALIIWPVSFVKSSPGISTTSASHTHRRPQVPDTIGEDEAEEDIPTISSATAAGGAAAQIAGHPVRFSLSRLSHHSRLLFTPSLCLCLCLISFLFSYWPH